MTRASACRRRGRLTAYTPAHSSRRRLHPLAAQAPRVFLPASPPPPPPPPTRRQPPPKGTAERQEGSNLLQKCCKSTRSVVEVIEEAAVF